ncbi:hypothetical protein RRG08_066784 [Elysia crispata]|uniref:Uncharacterized protein n=1 Tax=Elysia crispata TaxID=231223 RepID=A0AAE0XPT5_9GAST|nr:hypothetical protein RRG08_066784 [Elysia crispata]
MDYRSLSPASPMPARSLGIISLKKTNVIAQCTETPPSSTIDGYNLKVVQNFFYLGSIISSSLSIDSDINSRVAKAATVMANLNQHEWKNSRRTEKTSLRVYQACVLSTLLWGTRYLSEAEKESSIFDA